MTQFWQEDAVDDPLSTLQPWLSLFTLRALLANPSSCRISQAKLIINCLVPLHVKDKSLPQILLSNDFEQSVSKLVDAVDLGDSFSEFCHWTNSAQVADITFNLLGNKLKEQILNIMESTRPINQPISEDRRLLGESDLVFYGSFPCLLYGSLILQLP